MTSLFIQPQGSAGAGESPVWRIIIAVLFVLFCTTILIFFRRFSFDPAQWIHGFLLEGGYHGKDLKTLSIASKVLFFVGTFYLLMLTVLAKYKIVSDKPDNDELSLFWLGLVLVLGQTLVAVMTDVWYHKPGGVTILGASSLQLIGATSLYLYFRKGKFSGLELAVWWWGAGSLLSMVTHEASVIYAINFGAFQTIHQLNGFVPLLILVIMALAAWFLIRHSPKPLQGKTIGLYWLGLSILVIRAIIGAQAINVPPLSNHLPAFSYGLSIGAVFMLVTAVTIIWRRKNQVSQLEPVFYLAMVAFFLVIASGYLATVLGRQIDNSFFSKMSGYVLSSGVVALFSLFTLFMARYKMAFLPLFFHWLVFAVSISLFMRYAVDFGWQFVNGEAASHWVGKAGLLAGVVIAVLLGLWLRRKNVSFAGGRVIGFEFAVSWFVLSLLSVWSVVGLFLWQKWQPWPERFIENSVYNSHFGQAGMMVMSVVIVLSLLVLVWLRRAILTWPELIIYSLWGSFLLFEVGKGLIRPFTMPQMERYMVLGSGAAIMVLYFIVLKVWQKKAATTL